MPKKIAIAAQTAAVLPKLTGTRPNLVILDEIGTIGEDTMFILGGIKDEMDRMDPVHKGMRKFKFGNANITKTRRR
ncbi:hypothetical protein PXK56_18215 [Phaeobacter gallaeciensis]|uniref:hypothetical protein n=1 Tax=Phaeobacter gallaeciensis TaxID=60890 RepID=UPI0023803C5F|nr:hypothetical protein [Phaeobacter gallaeciensis]MDE4297122.1 hypothetical protein [Phaeobacter gallaeciensis]